MNNPAIVLFDCDDVLMNINDEVYQTLGYTYPTNYNYSLCFSDPTMIQNITDAYGNPKTFERAQFAKGADTITNLESHNSIVQICTRSYTQEVMSVKMKRLPEHTHIDPSKIIYQIGPGAEKVYPNADIIVEDCLENLVRLPGDKVKILINKTHNQASLDFDFYHRIYRFADLESSLDFIRSILDSGLVYNKAWRNLKFISTKGE